MKAYRICEWKAICERDAKGKAANAKTGRLTRKKPDYARWKLQGHSIDPRYRRLTKKAFEIGKMMGAACIGLYAMLLDLARDWDEPKLRGWIIDDVKRPLDAYGIAEQFMIVDKEHVRAALELLCDPEIRMLEYVEYPQQLMSYAETGGIEGEKAEKSGKEEIPFLNVTETERGSLNLNETERGEVRGRPEQTVESTAAPSSDTVSGSASEHSASVSGSVPRQGRQYSVEEVRRLKQIAGLKLAEILRPRSTGDHTTFRDIMDQLEEKMISETDLDLFTMAVDKAAQCQRLSNPRGAFVAAMKQSPFYYIPKGISIIKGAQDKYRR